MSSSSAERFPARPRPPLLLRQNPGSASSDRGKIGAPRASGRRGHGGGQRLFHGPRSRADAVPERVAPGETGAAFLVQERRGQIDSPKRASSAARYQVRLPSYQLDRATFDEEVLRRACRRRRGAAASRERHRASNLSPGGEQTLTFEHGETHEDRSRPLGRRCLRRRRAARAQERLVAAEHRASHRRRLVALERGEGLGRPGAGGEISGVGVALSMASAAPPPITSSATAGGAGGFRSRAAMSASASSSISAWSIGRRKAARSATA